jgi:hypothetical protein
MARRKRTARRRRVYTPRARVRRRSTAGQRNRYAGHPSVTRARGTAHRAGGWLT